MGNVSDIQKSTKSYVSNGSISYVSQTEYNIDLNGVNEEEIDKIYSTIVTRMGVLLK